MQQDTTHTILRSARHFFSGTVLSRISGMLRDVSMAAAFGAHESVAAFLVAYRLSHLLRRLFGEGAMQSAFVPQFEQLRQRNPQKAFGFFRDLMLLLAFGLSLLVTIVIIGCEFIIRLGLLDPENLQIVILMQRMMPGLLFICLYGLSASLLQCEKSYFIPGVAPVVFNVIWILGVLILWYLPVEEAMQWLSLWMVCACFGQWIITMPQVWKIFRQQKRDELLLQSIGSYWKEIRSCIKPLLLGILGVAATQINSAVDAIFAWHAEEQGPAFLWYALRMQQLPLALFGVAVTGALLPPLARAAKAGNEEEFQKFLKFGLRRTVIIMLPITIGIFLFGRNAISLLYGRGDFDAVAIEGTLHCLWGYGLGLLPMVLVLLLASAFHARSEQRVPALASACSVVINILLNIGMIFGLGLGAMSIAIATSISAWFNLGFLAWNLRKRDAVQTTVPGV